MTDRYMVMGYGESDLPEMTIVAGRVGVQQAIASMIWFPPESADPEELAAYMAMFDDPDQWSWNGTRLDIRFEIGGVEVTKIHDRLEVMPPRIVCAANQLKAAPGVIVLGLRHWDMHMHSAANATCGVYYHALEWEQGFINARGQFLSRTEAWIAAQANNQIIRRVGGDTMHGGCLFSENLY